MLLILRLSLPNARLNCWCASILAGINLVVFPESTLAHMSIRSDGPRSDHHLERK